MDLLIKNIELPKAGELWLWLAVNSDGTVSVYEHDKNARKTTASEWQDGKIDSLLLLKEKEPVEMDYKVIGLPQGDFEVPCCPDCRNTLDPTWHYCPHCSLPVKGMTF